MIRILLFCLIFFSCSSIYAQEESTVIKQDTGIVRQVDKIPQFRGGTSGWSTFVRNNFNAYQVIESLDSVDYVKYGARQVAILEFIVCEDGTICNIEITNKDKISPAFAREALRVMKQSPKWEPAIYNDRAVKTRIRQSIVGVLEYL